MKRAFDHRSERPSNLPADSPDQDGKRRRLSTADLVGFGFTVPMRDASPPPGSAGPSDVPSIKTFESATMLPHTPSSAESGSGSQPSLEGTLTRVQQALTVWNGSLELAPASIEQSFQLLKRVLMGPASQGHHLMREQVTEWCGAMIWFTSRLEQYSTGHGAINVARLVDCGILKTSGGEAMKPTTMRPLLDVCKHVVDAVVQVDPQPYCQRLIADIQKASTCYSVLSEMYNTYNSAYGTLIRRNPNPIIAEDDPVHRYGWLFFLAGADQNFAADGPGASPWESNDVKTWCIYCVLFLGTQLPFSRRLSVAEVFSSLFGLPLDQFHVASGIPQIHAGDDWIHHFESLRGWLCRKHERDITLFRQFESISVNRLIETLRQLSPTPRFQYDDQPVMLQAGCPWHLYSGALETLLWSNLEDLNRYYDCLLIEKGYQFDPRTFRPVGRPLATPKRFCRTPRLTSVRKSTASRSLRTSLERMSVFNDVMLATPLMARVGLVAAPRTAGAVRDAPQFAVYQAHFLQLFQHENASSDRLLASPTFAELSRQTASEVIRHASQNCDILIAKLRPRFEPFAQALSLAPGVYYHILHRLTAALGERNSPRYVRLLNDKQFIRCILFISFEIIRYIWQIGTKATTDELIHLVGPSYTTLAMVLELVNGIEFPFSGWIRKRLVELQERTLESQIWRDPVFYKMLDVVSVSSTGAALQAEFPTVTEVLEFYGRNRWSRPATVNEPEPSEFIMEGISQLRGQIHSMIYGRLKQLCDDLHMPSTIHAKAWDLTQWGLQREHEYHLLQNRNVDVYLICCLHGAAIMEGRPIKFKAILVGYEKQPQYVQKDKMLTNLYMKSGEKADLTVYYNKVFLAFMRGHMSSRDSRGSTTLHHPQPSHCTTPPHQQPQTQQPSWLATPICAGPPVMPPGPSKSRPGALAFQMTPRTHRYSSIETPLTPRHTSPGTPCRRRLFTPGASGLPPRVPRK